MGVGTAKNDRLSRSEWIIVLLLTTLAAVLRSVSVGREALWGDEALTYVLAQVPAGALGSAPIDPTAPLYYWLHQWLIPDGASATIGRSISVVAGVLTVPVAYALARSIVGREGAWIAAGWIAVIAPLVDYAQEARAYALLVLLVSVSALALRHFLRGGQKWTLAAFVVATLLALYTHFIAWFWAGPAVLLLFARRRRAGLAAGAVIGLAFLPELMRTWRYATQNNAFTWLKQPDLIGFLELVSRQWFAAPWPWLSATALTAFVGLTIWQWWRVRQWASDDPVGLAIVAILIVQPIVLWLFGRVLLPVIMPRTLLPSALGVALLLAFLLKALPARLRLVGGSALLLGALAATLAGGLVREKEKWAGVRYALAGADPARDLILACPLWKLPSLMATTRDLRSAPMAMPGASSLQLIERSMGNEPRWDRLFYHRAYEAFLGRAMRKTAPVNRSLMVPARNIYVVTSQCSDGELAAMRSAAGPHRIDRQWISESGAEFAAISVQRWQRSSDAPIRVDVRP